MFLLIIWFIFGLVISFGRVIFLSAEAEDEEVNGFFWHLSWAQIIVYLFVCGPFSIVIGAIYLITALVKRFYFYWNKLGEIGQR